MRVRLRMSRRIIDCNDLMFMAIIILLILTCLPMTQVLPEIIRKALQIFAMLLFGVGIVIVRDNKLSFGFIVFVVVYFLFVVNVSGYKQGMARCLFNTFACAAFTFYGIYHLKYCDDNGKKARLLLKIIVVIFAITAVTTIIGLQKYPLAVRELGRSTSGYSTYGTEFLELKKQYKKMNIASWSILYGMALFAPELLIFYKKDRKIFYLVLYVVFEFCIFNSQLTFAILLSLFASILLLFNPNKRRKGFIIIGIMSIVFLIAGAQDILSFVVSFSESKGLTMVSRKISDLLMLLSGRIVGDASSRFELYGKSVNLFFNHPFIGNALYSNRTGIYSEHSDFFDFLGYYGFFGFSLLILAVICYLKMVKKELKNNYHWDVLVLFMCLCGLSILNPVWYSPQVFAGAILVPLLLRTLINE